MISYDVSVFKDNDVPNGKRLYEKFSVNDVQQVGKYEYRVSCSSKRGSKLVYFFEGVPEVKPGDQFSISFTWPKESN